MKNKRPNIKCLPLSASYTMDFKFRKNSELERYTYIEPIFNRNGMYLNATTQLCWGECDGIAFLIDNTMSKFFFQDIEEEDVLSMRLSAKQIESMKYLLKTDCLPKATAQKIRARLDKHFLYHSTYIRKQWVESAQRFKEFKKKIAERKTNVAIF